MVDHDVEGFAMRKLRWVAAGAALALATAGLAAAGLKVRSVQTVEASLTASSTEVTAETCGDVRRTRGVYTGTLSGDERLAGPARLRLASVVDTASGDGSLSGELTVTNADGKAKLKARLSGVVDGGSYTALLSGKVRQAGKLVATISGSLSESAISGTLGSAGPGAALVLEGPACKQERKKEEKAALRSASGEVTALSAGSITVGALTCTVSEELAKRIADGKIEVGTAVRIGCSADGKLVKIGRAKKD
jgi:hypothetical protein